jgi:hypothetical protein
MVIDGEMLPITDEVNAISCADLCGNILGCRGSQHLRDQLKT